VELKWKVEEKSDFRQ